MNLTRYRSDNRSRIFMLFLLVVALVGCNSSDIGISEDPYAGGKEALGIKLKDEAPIPASGYPGDTILFQAKGLLAWSNPEVGQYNFKFFMADEVCDIVAATDSTISVKVPQNVSSGITYLLLKGQIFFGPKFNVLGNISIDTDYGLQSGSNRPIYNYLRHRSLTNNFYLVGAFTSFGSNALRNRIAFVNAKGNIAAFTTPNYNLKYGVLGLNSGSSLNSMSYFKNGKILISGTFDNFENISPINNITVLKNDAFPDTVSVTYSSGVKDIVPRYNGGTMQPIVRSFVTSDDRVIAVGDLTKYLTVNYNQSNKLNKLYTYADVATVIRTDALGSLDKSYRASATGASGAVNDAYMDARDGIVIVGDFTSFDGKPANRIVKLDPDGNVDQSFLLNIGSGADGEINMIRYNANLGKAMIVGNFTQFNGRPCNGVAMINNDGTLDEIFALKELEGGNVNFASVLTNGKVVVSGTFKKYDHVYRQGFIVLDKDGAATQKFNVPGVFSGQLYQVVETLTTTGANGLLLLGNFSRFNGERINNVVMLKTNFE